MPLLPPPRLLLLLPAPCDKLRSTCLAHSAALLLLLPPWRSLLLLLRWLWRSRLLLLLLPAVSLSSMPASCLTIFAMAPSRALIHSTISVSASSSSSSSEGDTGEQHKYIVQ
jgi:hypothetical protein